MATNAPDECSLCTEKYDEEEKAPRTLPCSHSFCTECIDNLILQQTKVCPFCRERFHATSARGVWMNRGLVDVLMLLKEKEQQLLEFQERGAVFRSKEATLKELKKETKNFTQEIIGSYQHAEERINSAIQSMKELGDKLVQEVHLIQVEILTKVKKLVENTIQKVRYIEEQIKVLENRKEAMKNKQSQMEAAIRDLEAAHTFTQADPLIDKVENVNSEAQESLEVYNDIMSGDKKMLHFMEKVAKDTRENMSIIQEVLNSPVEGKDEMQFLPHLQQWTNEDNVPRQMTMKDFQLRNEAVRSLMRKGKVYAEQEEGDRKRHARMTLDEENRICLHHLSDERLIPLPHDAHLLQYDDVMSVVNPSSARSAFLEIGTDEESLGKVVINLKPKSIRADNFVALCNGREGPSYVKTKPFKVVSKDLEGETVFCGDYEFNDGRGGKEVIPGAGEEWGGPWKGPWVVGSVDGGYGGSAKASQFGIVTKDDPNYTLDAVFGTVDTGLNVIRAVVSRYRKIKKVKIIDCGIIILPL